MVVQKSGFLPSHFQISYDRVLAFHLFFLFVWAPNFESPWQDSQDSRAESYCCNRSIGYLEHCEYTHFIVGIPMRLILLWFWFCQIANVSASKSATVQKKSIWSFFFVEGKISISCDVIIKTDLERIFMTLYVIIFIIKHIIYCGICTENESAPYSQSILWPT